MDASSSAADLYPSGAMNFDVHFPLGPLSLLQPMNAVFLGVTMQTQQTCNNAGIIRHEIRRGL